MLQILDVHPLVAPNIWGNCPMLEVRAAADPLHHQTAHVLFERLQEKKQTIVPMPLRHFATQAHALVDLALLLQRQAGSPVSQGAIQATRFPHVWRLAFEIEEPQIGHEALEISLRLLNGLSDTASEDLGPHLARLRSVVDEFQYGNTTRALIRAAHHRDIPVVRLDQESLLLLGQGKQQHRLQTAMTDRTSHVAEGIARDKQLTKRLLARIGIPVPDGRLVRDANDAVRAASEIGAPVVVKPRNSDFGNGVTLNLTDPVRIRSAYQQARVFSSDAIVERFLPGDWHRLLVVGREMVAAVRCLAPRIVGDGQRTIAALIEQRNSEIGLVQDGPFSVEPLHIGAIELAVLYRQGFGLDSTPALGQAVFVRDDAKLSQGAMQHDITDQVHPEVARLAIDAAEVIGLDIAGVDMVCTDIKRPMKEQHIAVLEVNAEPSIMLHLAPLSVPARPVAEAIVKMLFPANAACRIPHIGILGSADLAGDMERHLTRLGITTGRIGACDNSIDQVAHRAGEMHQAERLRGLWMHPRMEAVVVELSLAEIVTWGLPYDRFDMVFVSSLGELIKACADHDQRVVLREAWQVLLTAIENADTALWVDGETCGAEEELSNLPVSAHILARCADRPWLMRHQARGGHVAIQSPGKVSTATFKRETIHLVPDREEASFSTFAKQFSEQLFAFKKTSPVQGSPLNLDCTSCG